MPDDRPDPEALLASLHREEAKQRRGRLKVFFGMCPGVGKTYAMLRAAQQERHDGIDVVVGVVETHGRDETQALLAGLTVIPRRSVAYRSVTLGEMDLDAILVRRPQLVIVDELAHTNAPGSRHPKRFQDVIELLEAGVDVFSTLNVQHIESRADAVRQITGATIQETVPDSLLDLADEIELIDLTPAALLERLREGKVYLGESAARAEESFFQESHLTALREIALRFTAEQVEQQLRVLRSTSVKQIVWRSGERLLVAVGPSPFSTQLVRWTRRLAAAQGAPWVAVHVESSAAMSEDARHLLEHNLGLARELGAEVVVTHDADVPAALVRVALQHNATQIVVGKPRGSRWRELLRGGSLVDRLVRLGGNIDVYVVPADPAAPRRNWRWREPSLTSGRAEYAIALGTVAAITVGGQLLPAASYLAVGLVFLLAVIVLSLRVGRGPMLLAGVLSALTWNYLFIPPRFTFNISRVEDATLFLTYFAVAIIAGQLTARIRAQARSERRREERATALFQLTRALAEARDFDAAIAAVVRQLDELFGARSAVLWSGVDQGDLLAHFSSTLVVDQRELAVAAWVSRHGRPAGRFTDTLPAGAALHLPLTRGDHTVGVLAVAVGPAATLGLVQRDLLEAFARQLALAVEREHLRAASEREKLLAESEKLHRTLLDSVSHELRTPLAVINSALENLVEADATARGALVAEAAAATRRLNRLVGNLLDQTRLESGALKPRLDWCDARDLINAARETARDALAARTLEVNMPDDLPPVRADFTLMEQSLANLLVNAALHTPAASPIFVAAGLDRGGERIFFTVADRGPGFPAAMRDRLFRKFSRGDAAHAGGLGLGLSIVGGFVSAQGGEIVVGDNPGGGAAITIYLPHLPPQSPPPE